jgi:hypothetical protein
MLYVRTLNRSPTLRQLVLFIQKIYAPVWFIVKKEASFIRGPFILFSMIQDIKAIDETGDLKEIVFPVLQRSSFCCSPENFLASLVYSENKSHRELGVRQIQLIRNNPPKEILRSPVPQLNFDAVDWSQMVDVATFSHEPPITKDLTDEELERLVDDQELSGVQFPPIHSQSVERAVKLTSDTAKLAFTYKKRHEYILATMASREKRKSFTSKSKYVVE